MESSARSRESDSAEPRSAPGEARHYVTILFADLCASTRLAHAEDPEVIAILLRELKAHAYRVVEEHHGVLCRVYGDGVLALFGHPVPREDAVRCATEAALELHRAIRELRLPHLLPANFRARLHSGIHSGLTFICEGGEVEGRYELIGDPPNVAARLCSLAEVDSILVSAATLRGVLPFFDAEELPPARLKGKPEPIPLFRVLNRSEVQTRYQASVRRGLAPFVGREAVLERLHARLAEARRGGPTGVRLVGDPGVGKTRCSEEFISGAEALGWAVHRAYCTGDGSVAPLEPVRLILREMFQLSRVDSRDLLVEKVRAGLCDVGLEEHLENVVHLIGLAVGEGAERGARPVDRHSADVLALLFERFAARQPMVIFVDDWQWSDDASRQLAALLMKRLHDVPLLVLLAMRPSAPQGGAADQIEALRIDPFDEAESTRAIVALLPGGHDLGAVARIHEQSGGNPLFLEELCQSLGTFGDLSRLDARVPSNLHGLIEARVQKLPWAQAELVRTAAVIGNIIPSWLLERVSGYREGDEILRELATNDLLYAGGTEGTLRFKHGITREVVYHTVRLAQRRAIHRDVAQVLEQHPEIDGFEEALAYHHAGAANYLEAARYAEAAGDKAWASAALDRARDQYAAALGALDQLEPSVEHRRRWLDICRRRAFACIFSPALEQLDTLRRAAEYAEELQDLDELGHARFWLGFLSYSRGDVRASIEEYERGLEIARAQKNSKLIAQLCANLGISLAAAFDYEEALRLLDQSLELKQRYRSEESSGAAPTGWAYAVAAKGFILAELGDFRAAHELMRESLDRVERSGSPVVASIQSFRAIVFAWQGRWEECIEISEIVRAAGERVSGPYLYGRGSSEAAYARFMLTQDPTALEQLESTSHWLESHEMSLYISLNYGFLAEAMLIAKNLDGARHYAELALERAALEDRAGEGMALRVLGKLPGANAPGLEPPAQLSAALAAAQARGSNREIALTELALAEFHAASARPELARQLVGAARRSLLEMDMRWHYERSSELAALLDC